MSLTELISQIQVLSKVEKFLLMQFPVAELVKEEDVNFFFANQEYPVWSPFNRPETANVFMNLLTRK